jgi:putative FmdB family regulatory protein
MAERIIYNEELFLSANMPLYEYQCDSCGHRFEKIRQFSDPPLDVCPQCGKSPVTKLLSSPAIQFKGSGFYITDYAKKNSPSETEKKKADSPNASSSDTKSESKSESKSETKTETKTEAKTESKPAATSESK